MKRAFAAALAMVISVSGLADDGKRPRPLRVLYVGNTDTERGRSYSKFLGEEFTLTGAADRKTFVP
ncbi:MAG: hypothetical protein ACXVBG_21510, partial [Isosphaeraceae bacterium]